MKPIRSRQQLPSPAEALKRLLQLPQKRLSLINSAPQPPQLSNQHNLSDISLPMMISPAGIVTGLVSAHGDSKNIAEESYPFPSPGSFQKLTTSLSDTRHVLTHRQLKESSAASGGKTPVVGSYIEALQPSTDTLVGPCTVQTPATAARSAGETPTTANSIDVSQDLCALQYNLISGTHLVPLSHCTMHSLPARLLLHSSEAHVFINRGHV